MASRTDERMIDLRVATSLNDSYQRMDRAYWLIKLALTEAALLSRRDARNQFLPGNNSVSDDYYTWLGTLPGGNIPGSIADREMATALAGGLP